MATTPEGRGPASIESALRHLGVQDHGLLVDLIKHAIERPRSEAGVKLAPLTQPTATLVDWTAAERAHALWRIIVDGILDPDVSPTAHSRTRRVLQAAFRLRDDDIREPWGSSLTARFKQLRALRTIFHDPTSTQPMEMAWKRGVQALATYVEDRFAELRTPADWEQYRPDVPGGRQLHDEPLDEWQAYFDQLGGKDAVFRQPSRGAQPIFVNLFVTTVFMRKRAVYRRITERLVTATADGVEYYTARGFAGKTPRLT